MHIRGCYHPEVAFTVAVFFMRRWSLNYYCVDCANPKYDEWANVMFDVTRDDLRLFWDL